MNDEYTAANAADEEYNDDYGYDYADEVEEDAADTGVAAGEENVPEQGEENSVPEDDVTRTQAFARRLRESTDAQIAAAGIVNPFTGQLVRSADELRQFGVMMQADQQGRDVNQAAAEADMRLRLSAYEDREQEAAVMADPMLSQYYGEFGADARQVVAMARADGRNVTLTDALKAVMMQNFESVRRREEERIRQDTIKHYNAQAKATPGAIGGSETTPPQSFATMSDEEFDKALERALRGEYSSAS